MSPDDSFAALLPRLQAGDEAVAAEVFNRFSRRLIGLARVHLDARLKQKVDPEDILQSVMKSFFLRQGRGDFDLATWDSLWALLARITLRKCGHQLERYLSQGRDIHREAKPVVNEDSASSWQGLCQEPTASQAAVLAETVQLLLAAMEERDREVVTLLLQEYSAEEIAPKVGRSERAVYRVQKRAREKLSQLLGDNPQISQINAD